MLEADVELAEDPRLELLTTEEDPEPVPPVELLDAPENPELPWEAPVADEVLLEELELDADAPEVPTEVTPAALEAEVVDVTAEVREELVVELRKPPEPEEDERFAEEVVVREELRLLEVAEEVRAEDPVIADDVALLLELDAATEVEIEPRDELLETELVPPPELAAVEASPVEASPVDVEESPAEDVAESVAEEVAVLGPPELNADALLDADEERPAAALAAPEPELFVIWDPMVDIDDEAEAVLTELEEGPEQLTRNSATAPT